MATEERESFERLEDDLRALPDRLLPRADELRRFASDWVKAWNAHDLDALGAMVTDDVVWDDPAMRGQTVHGPAEFREFAGTFFEAFPDAYVEGDGVPFLALDGSGFAVRSHMRGTFTGPLTLWSAREAPDAKPLPPTGRAFDIRGVDLYELRDGRVAEWTIVYDLVDFSQQIGLMPAA